MHTEKKEQKKERKKERNEGWIFVYLLLFFCICNTLVVLCGSEGQKAQGLMDMKWLDY